MKKHSSRPSKTRLGRVRLRLRVRLQGRVKVKANVYWCLRTHNKLRQSADVQRAKSSKPAPNVANCKTQTWPRQRSVASCNVFNVCRRASRPDGNFLRLFASMTVCGHRLARQSPHSTPSLSLHLSCTLWAFHFVSLKGVSEILPHLTLNDSCSALGQTAIHSLNDGIRRDSRERAQRTQPWQSAEGGESVRGGGKLSSNYIQLQLVASSHKNNCNCQVQN